MYTFLDIVIKFSDARLDYEVMIKQMIVLLMIMSQGLSQRPVYPSFGRVIPFVDG